LARRPAALWKRDHGKRRTRGIGWSDTELASRVSVRPGAIRDWRTGRRQAPPNLLEWLRMYAEAIERLPPLPKDWTRS
jgi:hypothetical protein